MSKKISAILFDLDGTLQDTAIDLAAAINRTRAEKGLPEMDYTRFRHSVHGGANCMVNHAFDMHPGHPEFNTLKLSALNHYADLVATQTPLFEGIPQLLDYIEFCNIPWGVVTTKSMRYAIPSLKAHGLDTRARCIVAGDTVSKQKPHPDPLLHACTLLDCAPQETVYIGDNIVDVQAAKAAQFRNNVIVSYGYYDPNTHPCRWDADLVVHHPQHIIEWLKSQLK